MQPVAIVRHQRSVPPGHIERALADAGVDHFLVDGPRTEQWPSARDISALIVLGGTMNVDQLDRYPFLRDSRALMSDALERGVPTLGVCLGSQMMARVLGAEVRRSDTRNALFSPLEPTEAGRADPLLKPFLKDVEVLQFHEDTFMVPDAATALATSAASGLAQAFRYEDRAYAIQFHFEVDRPIVRKWIDDIGEQGMADEWGCADGGRSLEDEDLLRRQEEAGKELVARFLDL